MKKDAIILNLQKRLQKLYKKKNVKKEFYFVVQVLELVLLQISLKVLDVLLVGTKKLPDF